MGEHEIHHLKARVQDCVSGAEKAGAPRFTGFLSPEERQEAESFAARLSRHFCYENHSKNNNNVPIGSPLRGNRRGMTKNFTRHSIDLHHGGVRSCKVLFYGGYDGAQRTLFGAFPGGREPEPDDFPLTPLTLRYPARYELSHRDFLGALMALGLRRDAVGDIFPEPGRCVIIVLSELADYVLSQLDTVGRVGVKAERGIPEDFAPVPEYEEQRHTIASPRLDAVVAAITRSSREDAARQIRAGLVRLAGAETDKITAQVRGGDTLSVRFHGKYLVDSITELTKKGRTVLKIRKFR